MGRRLRHAIACTGLILAGALAAGQAAQAVTCCYTLRLGRTAPQPLWVGISEPPIHRIGIPVGLQPSVGPGGNATWLTSPADTPGTRSYRFINRATQKCMDIVGPSNRNGTQVHQWDCHNGASQAWKLIRPPVGRGIGYQVINVYAHKCLDVTGFRNSPYTILQVYSCTEVWNQDFVLDRVR